MDRPASWLLCVVIALTHAVESGAEDAIDGVGPVSKIARLHTGFKFVEGPAADRDGAVYFTDIPESRIYKVDSKGELSVFTDDSGHANGLMFDAAGRLLACQMDGRLAAYAVDTKKLDVLASTYEGKRFNAPNDLVIDAARGVYFTDPHFRAPDPRPQDKLAVYYVPRDGKPKRLIDDLKAPNGVILSPDEKTLYVIPSLQAEMMAYPVRTPGVLGEGRVLCRLKQPAGQTGGGGDGLTIDTKGNLYITSRLGLQVFTPSGKPLGVIKFPETPANVTFGGADRRTLYVTARTSLYTCRMAATGHVFARPRKK